MNRTQNKTQIKTTYSAKVGFLITLIYAALLAYMPLALFANLHYTLLEGASIAATVLCTLAIFKLSGEPRAMISFIILCVVFFFFGSSFLTCGLLSSMVGAVTIFACLLQKATGFAAKAIPFLVTAAVYIAVALALGSFLKSAIVFLFLPAAMILSHSLRHNVPRVPTICRVSFGLLLPFAAILAVWVLLHHEGDISVIPAAINSLRTSATDLIAKTYRSAFNEAGYPVSAVDAKTFADNIVSLVFNVIPAMVVISVSLLAFAFQSFAAAILSTGEKDEKKLVALYRFKMSTASAVLFLVFLILFAVFSEESEDMLAMVAMNLSLIFIPPLIYTTMISIRRLTVGKNTSCFGFLIYLGVIMLLFRAPEYSIMGVAIAGAALIIIDSIKTAIKKRQH